MASPKNVQNAPTACHEAERLADRYKVSVDRWQQAVESLKKCTDLREYQRAFAVGDALYRDVQAARQDFFQHRREHGC